MEKLSDAIVASYRDCGTFMANNDQIKSMASELLQLRQRAAEMEWVKVSERLPENGKEVDILWVYDMDPTALFRGNTVKYPDETGIYVDDGDNDKTVVYWKYSYPLPPQESEKESEVG